MARRSIVKSRTNELKRSVADCQPRAFPPNPPLIPLTAPSLPPFPNS
jgi:hypothetical protein